MTSSVKSSTEQLTGLRLTNTFWKLRDAYDAKHQLIIQQGGTSSGKTYATLQLLYLIAKHSPQRKIISVVSYALPHLRTGAIRDFENILEGAGVIITDIRNKTDNQYSIGNSIIEFFGAENTAKVHGPRRDILYINEAIDIKYEIYTQLRLRTTGVTFVDYNPKYEFWVHDTVMREEDHFFIKTTYLDNHLLHPNIVKQIESRRHNPYFWRVYGLGEIGAAEGAIFTNWRVGEFDHTLPYYHGLDFGFHPDPDACSKVAIDRKKLKIYADEKFYVSGQSFNDLKSNLEKHIKPHELIVADSAEKRLINDLSTHFNIKAVSKRGMVVEWLRKMEDYEIIITEGSKNTEKELRNYQWHDKKAGIPIDGFNHAIDEIRYCFMEFDIGTRTMTRVN